MGSLDNLLDNQQKTSMTNSSGNSLLKKLSEAYKLIGFLPIVFGIVLIIFGLSDFKDKGEGIGYGICIFFGGLFVIFLGCVGEAIDDIRKNTNK